jgi:hypothetical protein
MIARNVPFAISEWSGMVNRRLRSDLLPEDQMAASLPIQYILNLP